jgi:hypothetical protein
MKPRKPFATREQRTAWQAECRREAARRMTRRLIKQLRHLAEEPAPPGQRQLAQQYRVARARHVKELQREREDAAISRHLADELQMDLALAN